MKQSVGKRESEKIIKNILLQVQSRAKILLQGIINLFATLYQ